MIKDLTQFVKESILNNAEDVLSLDNAYDIYKVDKSNFTKISGSVGQVVSNCKALIHHMLSCGIYNLHDSCVKDANKITGFGIKFNAKNSDKRRAGYFAFFDDKGNIIDTLNGWYVPPIYGDTLTKLRDTSIDVINKLVTDEKLFMGLLKGAQEYDTWFDDFRKDPKNRTYVGSAMMKPEAAKIIKNKDKNVFIDLIDKH